MAWLVGEIVKTIDIARLTVEKVVLEKGFKDPKALRIAMFHAYPFELRQGYPYHAWLKVIKSEIGGMRSRKPDPRQIALFDGDT
jgi:hypothetical protein